MKAYIPLLFGVLLLFTTSISFGQDLTIDWSEHYGGSANDIPNQMITTNDGGFAIIGSTGSTDEDVSSNAGNGDVWLIKIDNSGNLQWEKTFGGSEGDNGYGIVQTSNNDFLFVGLTRSSDGDVSNNHGDADIWILMVDQNGNMIWEKTYGGSDYESPDDIIKSADGGFIISGFSQSTDGDFDDLGSWVFKIDANGNLDWKKEFEPGHGPLIPLDGNTFAFGISNSLYKLDETDGSIIWQNDYNVPNSQDNLIILNGVRGNNSDILLIGLKLGTDQAEFPALRVNSSDGNVIWNNVYSYDYSSPTSVAIGVDILPLSNGNFLLLADSYRIGDPNDVGKNNWLILTDENGDVLSENHFGGSGIEFTNQIYFDKGSIVKTQSGDIAIVSRTTSSDGDVPGNYGGDDFWAYGISGELNVTNHKKKSISVYPNPTSGSVNFNKTVDHIEVFDLLGEKVKSYEYPTKTIDISSLNEGVYIIKARNIEQGEQTMKVIKR